MAPRISASNESAPPAKRARCRAIVWPSGVSAEPLRESPACLNTSSKVRSPFGVTATVVQLPSIAAADAAPAGGAGGVGEGAAAGAAPAGLRVALHAPESVPPTAFHLPETVSPETAPS